MEKKTAHASEQERPQILKQREDWFDNQLDFDPAHLEMAFSKLKALLRKAAERTVEGLWDKIGEILSAITPRDCASFFAATGYEPI